MTVVVTGAGGFIGGRLVHALHERGCKVWGCDTNWRPHAEALPLAKRFTPDELLRTIESRKHAIGYVYHFGAVSDSECSDLASLKEANVKATINLYLACRNAKVPRFVYASSAATYGDGANGFGTDPKTTRSLKPLSPYAQSKHDVDRWFLQTDYWKNVVGLKFFNVYGRPEDEVHKGRSASLIGRIADAIRADRPVELYDVQAARDFVHVDDAVDAAMLAAEADPIRCRGLLNVGTGTARTFEDLTAAVAASLGRTPTIEYAPLPEALAPQYQRFTQANLAGWAAARLEPRFRTLEAGVRHALNGK